MRRLLSATVLAGAVALGGVAAVPAQAVNIGNEGCTPGYWKNHTDNWEEAAPSALVGSIYGQAVSTATKTLEEALQGGGGPGAAGGERILIRAATAAWLNAAHEGLGYPWRRFGEGLDGRQSLRSTVNAALRTQDRQTMLTLAAVLDTDNNLGCQLS